MINIKSLKKIFLWLLFLSITINEINGQCTNTTQWPENTLTAPVFNTPTVLTTESWAGDFIKLQGLVLNKTYQFSSSKATDYLTIRRVDNGALLAHGASPVSLAVGSGPDIINIHINLQSPPCGSQNENRSITATCTDCSAPPANVGIDQSSPKSKLDVNGKIKLADDANIPQAGMIRWNSATSDFEGYNGTKWVSLTKSNSSNWGNINSKEVSESSKLTAGDGAADDFFGSSISISGDYAIIGVVGDDVGANADQGSAYIFHRSGTTWTQQAKLIASDGATNDYFGWSASISGDYAIIGADGDDVGANANQGSAYIFIKNE